MADKQTLIKNLREEFERWVALLAGLSEAEVTAHGLPDGQSIKDVMGHLWAWQTRSVARMEAALNGGEPDYSALPADLPAEVEGQPHAMNAWIHATNIDKDWATVYGDWRRQFLRFLDLAAAVPEAVMMEQGVFGWLEEYPLAAVLEGSWAHHHEEHYEPLVGWLKEKAGD